MPCDRIVISSGHGKYVRGASGIIDEVDEARRVVEHLADELRARDVRVVTYHDDVSQSQNENLNRLVDFHNSQPRDLDLSVHFNAYVETDNPMGTEVLYVTQATLAAKLSHAIAQVGLIDRGAKKRTDLFFLNNTEMPAVLLEVCFVDSEQDCLVYRDEFDQICENIACVLGGDEEVIGIDPPSEYLFEVTGKCSHFGGPDDTGVSDSEGLAFHYAITEANQHLFLPFQPSGTTGLARRLNAKAVHYVACRWNYDVTPKEMLAGDDVALVTSELTGMAQTAFPADYGPHGDTDRVADLSPALMRDLDLETDDSVIVVYPWKGDLT
jgi:hypothetical protein